MTDKVVAFVTVPSKDSAERLVKILLEKKLVGCVNIISGIGTVILYLRHFCILGF